MSARNEKPAVLYLPVSRKRPIVVGNAATVVTVKTAYVESKLKHNR